MKNQILGCIILVFISLPILGQNELKSVTEKLQLLQTNQDEYDFMMEGYQKQVQYDLAMKKGYKFINKYSEKIGGYTFISRDLIRIKTDQYVGTMIYVKAQNGQEEYIAIPYMNEDLMDIHKAHLVYILRNKRLGTAYSEFYSKKMAAVASVTY